MQNDVLSKDRFRLEIFLISLGVILLEISYTRVFSFKLFYYFTYLIIGIVMLGLGSGAILVTASPWLRRIAPARLVAGCCLLASVGVVLGYAAVATIQLNVGDLTRAVSEVAKLALMCALLAVPFLAVGIAIATIFGARPREINRLYFWDLLGAGLGCAIIVPLLATLTPPVCVFLSGLLFALSGLRLGHAHAKRVFGVSALMAAGLAIVVAFPGWIPDPVPDRVKSMSPQRLGDARVLFSRWSPVFRVDVVEGDDPSRHMLHHDGMLGSSMFRYDGDADFRSQHFEVDPRRHPFDVLEESPEVLVIGSAGGHELLASLYFGARSVTGVELNPVTVSLLEEHFADYTGRLVEDERVTLVNAEGRSFLKRDPSRYDLIWFVAPDSYAAMNAATSGAFVLSESYLYTDEMILEALEHLKEGGLICVQFGEIAFDRKPNRTVRYLATARRAFGRLGIENFGRHVLLSTTPEFFTMATILLKKTPFTEEEIERFRAGADSLPFRSLTLRSSYWSPSRNMWKPASPSVALISMRGLNSLSSGPFSAQLAEAATVKVSANATDQRTGKMGQYGNLISLES